MLQVSKFVDLWLISKSSSFNYQNLAATFPLKSVFKLEGLHLVSPTELFQFSFTFV